MPLHRKLIVLCLFLLLATSCNTDRSMPGVKIFTLPNRSTVFAYQGRLPGGQDLLCIEKPEITPFVDVKGELAVYTYVKMEGTFERRYDKIRETAKRQEEFDVARFHACRDFGGQGIHYADYQRYIKDILDFENKWLGRVEGGAVMLTYLSKDLVAPGSDKNLHSGLTFDKPYWQQSIRMGGAPYSRGVGMHPMESTVASAEFRIPQGARYFRTVLGFAELSDGGAHCDGDAYARIIIDGLLVRSIRLRGHAGPPHDLDGQEPVGIPSGAAILRLESDSAGPAYCDHVFWANARFTS